MRRRVRVLMNHLGPIMSSSDVVHRAVLPDTPETTDMLKHLARRTTLEVAYVRVPVPDGRIVLYTNVAELGTPVRRTHLLGQLESDLWSQETDQRRIASSGAWKL